MFQFAGKLTVTREWKGSAGLDAPHERGGWGVERTRTVPRGPDLLEG